ncbi:hypothetical protein SDC9_06642 [bioreactor metagenome]|jgi:hypothetical protein|uniref:Uncharacterized protein n=1 Tax=bioreactor metagenome TaxID=1076179 RepID=A0A644T2F0_9ZZZZ
MAENNLASGLDASAWLVIIIAVLKVVKVIIDEVQD